MGYRTATHEVRVAVAVFALALSTFAFFVQGGGPNQNSRFDLTRAIVEHRSLSIEAFHRNTFDKARVGDRHYSDKAPGLSFAAAPIYGVRYLLLGAPADAAAERNALYLLTLGTVSLSSAAASAALYLLLRHWKRSRFAALATPIAWCFGTPALAYSTLFVAHQLVAALLLLALALLVWRASRPPPGRGAAWLLAGAGALAGWAAISEYPAAPLAAGLFFYAGFRVGWRALGPFVLAAAVPLTLLAIYNASCFGSPLSLGYQHLAAPEFKNVIDRGFFGMSAPRSGVVLELLTGEFRGLLPLSPLFALAPLGWVMMARRPNRRAETALTAGGFSYLLLLASAYTRWDGGAAMGPRYLLPALPYAAIAIGYALDVSPPAVAARALRFAVVVVIATSVAICTLVTLVLPELPDADPTRAAPAEAPALDPRHPISQIIVPLAAEGLVSQKAVSPRGTMGLAAGTPGHADDAFNWGEKLGLGGVWSVIPLLGLWAVGALGIVRLHRGCRGASW